jgi:hypothetical protein
MQAKGQDNPTVLGIERAVRKTIGAEEALLTSCILYKFDSTELTLIQRFDSTLTA